MKSKFFLNIPLVLTLCALSVNLNAQSGSSYYRSSIHNANRVKTVFGNWGVIGQPVDTRPRGAWIYSSNGYLGDVSIIVGAEVKSNGTQFHSVVVCPVARPASSWDTNDKSQGGTNWSFMPVNGYFNPANQSVAMSDDPKTWPSAWPDRLNDPFDAGWSGSWNGYFGKRINANQESYFVMDDNNDVRFNDKRNNNIFNNTTNTTGVEFRPDSTNPSRNGMGLEVKVRGMQWSQFLAQDNIFFLYEIENQSTTNYERVAFGMLVGTLVGVTGTVIGPNESNDDWSFYDVKENITYTGDRDDMKDPFWQGPVGLVGYAFLESPGNPYDGIDNDADVPKFGNPSANTLFVESDFDSSVVAAGSKIILINDDFTRHSVTVGNTTATYHTRGADITIIPGQTKLAEGNRYFSFSDADTVINPNSYDGIDNDLDGLIDENYSLHYRQIKIDPASKKTLINILRPVHHASFSPNNTGGNFSMIDERRDDQLDNDKDWTTKYDDVGEDGLTGTKDPGESDGIPSKGEPNFDKTDVDESDQIGLTSFNYFAPSNQVPLGDDELMWEMMKPGKFTVPTNIENNLPVGGADGDFIYASGYFPLLSKKIERFSLALVYGGANGAGNVPTAAIEDLIKHKKIVQRIYDANYQFPIAPDPVPTLTAYADNGKVNLYWDRKSEDAVDPVLHVKDFQGYKIYRATDYEFNDAFLVTDANGIKKGYKPLFQFDLKDSIKGYYRAPDAIFDAAEGFTYFLGDNTGLIHDTTDFNVVNGKTYYYVIVAYDRGDENDTLSVFPSENSWKIDIDQVGRVRSTSQNVAIVVPGKKVQGYSSPKSRNKISKPLNVVATGDIYYNVLDEAKITGSTYEISFNDTRDSGKYSPVTTSYSVKDTVTYTGTFVPRTVDTIATLLPKQNLVVGSVQILKMDGSVVDTSKYTINYERGSIRAKTLRNLQDVNNSNKYIVKYKYYPIFKSAYIKDSPYIRETKDSEIFDGVQLDFENDWRISIIDSLSKFSNLLKAYGFTLSTVDLDLDGNGSYDTFASENAADYDMIFSNGNIDTTADIYGVPPTPVNFTLRNITENKKVPFLWIDNSAGNGVGRLSSSDNILFFEKNAKDSLIYTWTLNLLKPSFGPDTVFTFGLGDTLKLRNRKSFRSSDKFYFTTAKPQIEAKNISQSLSSVRVVPNPYVVQAYGEAPTVAGTFGRGERKIEFQNVPQDSKISIYTVRGEHIRTLNQDGSLQNGTVKWDVKTKENLDVSFGVYFYVIESSIGTRSGKIAVIK